jgi:deferrochelatase/peroxidase EfeB
MKEPDPKGPRISRRRLLAAAGGAAAVGAAGLGGLIAWQKPDDDSNAGESVEFWGTHQAGIATPSQHYLHFAAFDVITDSRDELVKLLQEWTSASNRMTRGLDAGEAKESKLAPPVDTGEAMGLQPSRLTITLGFGPTLFQKDGVDRFGLASKRPAALKEIPAFAGDELDPNRSDGDLCVQACADDPQVAFHAVRNLTRIGRGKVVLRWSQLGFNRTASTSKNQDTPRNLMGFKDGTNNLHTEDAAAMAEHVWVGDEGPDWMKDGSYVVTRRIRMTIEHWDRTALGLQEETIGRLKDSGAPMHGMGEFDPVDLNATDDRGQPAIPLDAHIRLASPSTNGNVRILRRGYSFTDGMDRIGELDAGLFFIAFQRDPHKQFVVLQRQLAAGDALNEYIAHNGSALFACPPGVAEGDWVGSALFQA